MVRVEGFELVRVLGFEPRTYAPKAYMLPDYTIPCFFLYSFFIASDLAFLHSAQRHLYLM